jgi:hypothetical protein
MQPRRSFDPQFLIVIALSVVSILGLAWILLTNYPSEPAITPTVEPTPVPFDFSPLETGMMPPPPSSTPTLEAMLLTATGTSPDAYPGPPADTPLSGSEPEATPAPGEVQPLPIGKYDDTHSNIAYDRYWTAHENSGTKFAYKGTLHISTSIGNEIFFRFTGSKFYLGYQRGRNFGIVTVLIDDQSYSFHEQALGNIWRSPQLSPGTHSVRLVHKSGQSVNLDYIEVWP